MYDREALKQLVRDKALKFGEFTLASGKKATYYLDCRQITLDSRGARLIGEGMLDLLGDRMPNLVGGMAIIEAKSKEEMIEQTKHFLQAAGDGETEIRQLYDSAAPPCS